MDIWAQIQEAGEIQSFEPLPSGAYEVCVTDAESKEDSAGQPYVRIEYTVLAGDYAKRKIFDNMYLYNSQYENLQKNGLAKLKRLSEIKQIVLRGDADVANFIGMEVFVLVKQYANKKGEIKNDVQDIKAPDSAPAVAKAPSVAKAVPVSKKVSPFG